MEGILKVTPEKLISTSQEFSSNGDTISSLTQQMIDIVTSLSSFWQGDASSAYSAKFNQLNDDIPDACKDGQGAFDGSSDNGEQVHLNRESEY